MRETIFYILGIILIITFVIVSTKYSIGYLVDRTIDTEIDNAEIICADSADFDRCLDDVLE